MPQNVPSILFPVWPTSGQWPIRPAATMSMEFVKWWSLNQLTQMSINWHHLSFPTLQYFSSLWGPDGLKMLKVASMASKFKLTSVLKWGTSIIFISTSLLTLTAMLVASEVMAASKQPRRSHLTSELNSVTSKTYITMLSWPLMATISRSSPEEEGQIWPIDLRGFAAGKNSAQNDQCSGCWFH